MTVFILKPDDTDFAVNRQAAYVGFSQKGDEVRLFEQPEFEALELDQDSIVIGGIGIVQAALQRMGLPVPVIQTIPEELAAFGRRSIWRASMAEARAAVERGESLFIKPLPTATKLFNGQVLRTFQDLIATAHLADDLIVECAEVTPFVSEYRAFVLRGDLVGFRHYKGDPLCFPDSGFVRATIAAYRSAPAGCAMDFGVCDDGCTRLVEVNDGYATGAYGLSPLRYASVIEARWGELRRSVL
nr:ATP-grasp domain-containing protein [Jiella sp. LLJ827]